MRTIIAGSRTVHWYPVVADAVWESGITPSVVLSGGADGVDRLGERWAREHRVPFERYLARWDEFGRVAGVIRNAEMARTAEALIAVWEGKSRGTADMIDRARRQGLTVFVYEVEWAGGQVWRRRAVAESA